VFPLRDAVDFDRAIDREFQLMKRIAIGLAAVLFASAAYAEDPAMTMDTSLGTVWTDANGMTLYTFDKDTQGAMMSACAGDCIVNWPPFLAEAGAMAEGDWTLVDVVDSDGATKKMWAYKGWPLYLWVKDTKAGDVTGDMVGGVWHAAKAE
jgi:predicted lipoprotein with Yx(FWY)xxD motif